MDSLMVKYAEWMQPDKVQLIRTFSATAYFSVGQAWTVWCRGERVNINTSALKMEVSIGDAEINTETDSHVEYQLRQERLRDLGRYVSPKYTQLVPLQVSIYSTAAAFIWYAHTLRADRQREYDLIRKQYHLSQQQSLNEVVLWQCEVRVLPSHMYLVLDTQERMRLERTRNDYSILTRQLQEEKSELHTR